MKSRRREGMALLTVLLLVAAVSALAVLMLDDVRFSVRRTANAELGAQAQWHALGAESLARVMIGRLDAADPDRTPVDPAWAGRPRRFPVEGGWIAVTVTDGQACFNLNSVVEGYGAFLIGRERGRRQLIALADAVGVQPGAAETLADSLTDWIDADAVQRARGAEDSAYLAGARPYRTGATLLAEVSELRAVRGVDAASYRALRPYVCAHPRADPSPINVNTLTTDQAPLLVMLTEGRMDAATARSVIASRPPAGWPDVAAFRLQPAIQALGQEAGLDQTTVRTRLFQVRADVELDGYRVVRTALLELDRERGIRTISRRWTIDE